MYESNYRGIFKCTVLHYSMSSVLFKGAKQSQNLEWDRGSDPDNLYESNVLVSSDQIEEEP